MLRPLLSLTLSSLPPSFSPPPPVFLQVVEREAVTGLELHQRISSAVHLLKMKGVVPGNRVLITMQPSVDFYALAIASFAVGKNFCHILQMHKDA